MGLFKRWHPPSVHEKNLKAPEPKRVLAKEEEISQIKRTAKKEYEESQVKKAREEEKKKFITELRKKDEVRKTLVQRIETEQKAIKKFREVKEEELKKAKKQSLTIEIIKKILSRFGFHFDPKSNGFKLKGKKFDWKGIQESFQPWKAFNSKDNYLFHPLGFLWDLASIVIHEPRPMRLRQMEQSFEKNLKAREKILEDYLTQLHTMDDAGKPKKK